MNDESDFINKRLSTRPIEQPSISNLNDDESSSDTDYDDQLVETNSDEEIDESNSDHESEFDKEIATTSTVKSTKKSTGKKSRAPKYSTEELNDLIRIADNLKQDVLFRNKKRLSIGYWKKVKQQMGKFPYPERTIKSYQYFYHNEKRKRLADIEYSLKPYELEELLEIKRLKEEKFKKDSRERTNRKINGSIWLKISNTIYEKFGISRKPRNLMAFYLSHLKFKSIEEIIIWRNSKANVLNDSDLKTMIYINEKTKDDGKQSNASWTKLSQEYFPNIESNRLAKLFFSRKERNLLPKIGENEEIIPIVNKRIVSFPSR